MSPAKKSRSINKRYVNVTEVSPSKGGDGSKRSNPRKRKLSMLGPQWSKEELSRFYDAYRKHGKDWKKVAAAVRNRSVDMVEALYSMNMAYLSLPEGTASVIGLIAMMTDHYCNMAESDSEQESNEGAGTSRKTQKRARGKVQAGTFKGPDLQPPTLASNNGCLSLLKKKRSGGTRPRVVGKRTPRFPVPYSYENAKGLNRSLDANDDEVAHEIAIALAEASKRGSSPQISHTPSHQTDSALSTPTQKAEKKKTGLEMVNLKFHSSEMDEDEGSMEADTGELHRLMETGRTIQKGSWVSGKKSEIDVTSETKFVDNKEACSGTEEGYRLDVVRTEHDMEVADEKVLRASSLGLRKRSKKVLFQRDDSATFEALQTLADLSLMMPTMENENELMMHIKDENGHIEESGTMEALPTNRQKKKYRTSGVKTKWTRLTSELEVASSAMSKHVKASVDDSAFSETKQMRKNQKISTSKAQKSEVHPCNDLSDPQVSDKKDALKKPISKGKRSLQQSSSPKVMKNQDHPSSEDIRIERSDPAHMASEVLVAKQAKLPDKVTSRRKTVIEKPQKVNDSTFPDSMLDNKCSMPFVSVNDKVANVQKKLSNCLSNRLLRRWCTCEWFYSPIDNPWFAKREFVEYLDHVGLGHVPRLTRVEWDVIRSSLGKPRRFSKQFLKEEKEKLYDYREFVRTHYTDLREGTREGLPTDLARPLSVGQRVIAIHPKTREIHDGSVLTVDHSRCRVQFDRPELGVEIVKDIECMPLNPYDNMPTQLSRDKHAVVHKLFENFNENIVNERANDNMKLVSGDNLENGDGFHCLPSSTCVQNNLLLQSEADTAEGDGNAKIRPSDAVLQTAISQPGTVGQNQAKEADVQALAKLTRALDKKDAVVSELRRMNDDILENQRSGDCTLNDSDPFRKQYASILVQLNEVNDQVSSALGCLRQRNTYQGNASLSLLPKAVANSGDAGADTLSTYGYCTNNEIQESRFHIDEIIQSSRVKARTMVDAAVQAMSSLNGVENSTGDVEYAIDYLNDRISTDELCSLTITDSNKLNDVKHGNEADIPSELITKCVATLLMIQKCTERQFPPADVAKILDSAVSSLQPTSSHNLPLFAEIENRMGIVRNQILARIPT
ncbi:unnamed protein product [Cuscuta epithymum]|uniref:SANT domain-containing protein n=2 Tax=Cuscuta epithymum TaxID=186058 RepID=A0AAV0GNV3_9ASTE|nr:unnamed protein product [Cuscuta epithymum]